MTDKLRITADGKSYSTRVETPDGKILTGISRIQINIDKHPQVRAEIEFSRLEVDVQASDVLVLPGGRMRDALFASRDIMEDLKRPGARIGPDTVDLLKSTIALIDSVFFSPRNNPKEEAEKEEGAPLRTIAAAATVLTEGQRASLANWNSGDSLGFLKDEAREEEKTVVGKKGEKHE
ncbi:MAG: hypothetical protein V3W14_07310 [Candidatus Neomarinimicrobiota bacterium]